MSFRQDKTKSSDPGSNGSLKEPPLLNAKKEPPLLNARKGHQCPRRRRDHRATPRRHRPCMDRLVSFRPLFGDGRDSSPSSAASSAGEGTHHADKAAKTQKNFRTVLVENQEDGRELLLGTRRNDCRYEHGHGAQLCRQLYPLTRGDFPLGAFPA